MTADLSDKTVSKWSKQTNEVKGTYSRSTIFIASAIFARCNLCGTLGWEAGGDAGLPGSVGEGALATIRLLSATRSVARSMTYPTLVL